MKSQMYELWIPVELDFSTDHLLKRQTLISFTFMMKFYFFPGFLYIANSFTLKESGFKVIIEASSDCYTVNNSQSHLIRPHQGLWLQKSNYTDIT